MSGHPKAPTTPRRPASGSTGLVGLNEARPAAASEQHVVQPVRKGQSGVLVWSGHGPVPAEELTGKDER